MTPKHAHPWTFEDLGTDAFLATLPTYPGKHARRHASPWSDESAQVDALMGSAEHPDLTFSEPRHRTEDDEIPGDYVNFPEELR